MQHREFPAIKWPHDLLQLNQNPVHFLGIPQYILRPVNTQVATIHVSHTPDHSATRLDWLTIYLVTIMHLRYALASIRVVNE